MASNITRTQKPEEREHAAKSADLAVLEMELAQRELDLATLRVELHAFERRYLCIVGVKFAEIDDLEAQIAEARNRRDPSNENSRRQAVEARTKATASAEVNDDVEQRTPSVDFKPSEELKTLYREIAKRVHPDLATDADERAKRNQVMAEVNSAYVDGDEARLRAILNEWETSPHAVTGDGVGAELIRTIRKIHQVQTRLALIEVEIAVLTRSELALLKARSESEEMNGFDVLADMAAELDNQIVQLRRQTDALGHHEASS